MSGIIALVTVLQLRSQAEVQRSLAGQDDVGLAFLIDDLHRANDQLEAEAANLTVQRDRLKSGSGQTDAALQDERIRLRLIEGLDAAHGPGVVITADAPLSALDLQDGVNNLRLGGAEEIAVNDRRVVTGSSIEQRNGEIAIDDVLVSGPWTIQAIGDPTRLAEAAGSMTRQLQTSNRVRSATYRFEPDLQIRATVAPRPYVYGSP
ncbi:MAG: DUF881 domain-containing protein [Candidatus Dormibacteraeota bacterium]|uniref:DUF881 domain-containing protein n=1 Tax=Candidatus Dormiibacter inghamiae TaxID=3127013 RepID=A0A934KEQ7_9BACT|nr:DUF881 domain-containing protein [Candidatus Dormibacteraeota bacterium]MBJ7606398.1 DUF881 domain-containing protein [Candidatus Dormibacteraeota bacterium]